MELIDFISELITNSTCEQILITAPMNPRRTKLYSDLQERFKDYVKYKNFIKTDSCKVTFLSPRDFSITRGFGNLDKTVIVIVDAEHLYIELFKSMMGHVLIPLASAGGELYLDVNQEKTPGTYWSELVGYTGAGQQQRILDKFKVGQTREFHVSETKAVLLGII